MTREKVIEKVKVILRLAQERDHEAAHSAEDKLHQEVLTAIANGRCDDPRSLAEAALKTQGIDFIRWCV